MVCMSRLDVDRLKQSLSPAFCKILDKIKQNDDREPINMDYHVK